jgi:HEAT repeat protein
MADNSFILKKRDLAKIIRNREETAIEELMKDPLAVMAAAVNDMLLHPTTFASTGIRIAHAALKGKMFQQFATEVIDLREKGKLPEDFSKNKNGYKTWIDLLKIIDDEAPDEDRLEALKAAFYAANKINSTDSESIIAYEVFQIAKELKSNEILVLRAYWIIWNDEQLRPQLAIHNYQQQLQKQLGGIPCELIQAGVHKLNEKRLVSNQVLTALGNELCGSIHKYRIDIKND